MHIARLNLESWIKIKDHARSLGIDAIGLTLPHPVPDLQKYKEWIQKNYQGTMSYLERGIEKRATPEKILPGIKSIISCAISYYQGGENKPIARYAWGEDYHEVLKEKLTQLSSFIHELFNKSTETKIYVDTGPILERSYAQAAGLGWIGKNTCLINDGLGSYIFLGEILTTIECDTSLVAAPTLDLCGTCTLCLDACPTQAFIEPYVMDSRRCISYLTIEKKDEFTPEEEKMVGSHLYGCDICQDVCPYNQAIPLSSHKEFYSRLTLPPLDSEKILEETFFQELKKGSAMSRIKYPQWKRNVMAVRKTLP